jgi:hypothetical protein
MVLQIEGVRGKHEERDVHAEVVDVLHYEQRETTREAA